MHTVDVEGAKLHIDHLGELRRHRRLLHIIGTNQHVKRRRLTGGELLAKGGQRQERHSHTDQNASRIEVTTDRATSVAMRSTELRS